MRRYVAPDVAPDFSPARPVAPDARGFTLVQLVLALAGLLFLSLVVPAWLAVRVNQGRVATAKRDARAIAEAIQRFEKDNGFLPAWAHASGGGPGAVSDRVDLLEGPGALPRAASEAEAGWLSRRTVSLDGQLVENSPGYGPPDATTGRGWRGPYLPSPVPIDPWGNRYVVSLGLDRPGRSSEGDRDAWVLSAGPNGIIETRFPPDSRAEIPGGDDVIQPVRSLTDRGAATRIDTPVKIWGPLCWSFVRSL